MPTCILHVGMPKTGTSSIQESLRFGLADSRFRLITLGESNAFYFLNMLFGDNPGTWWVARRKGLSPTDLRRLRHRFDRRLRDSLRHSLKSGVTPIVSAESCWMASPAFLGRIEAFMAEQGFTVRAIAYMRPFHGLIESLFQQQVRYAPRAIDLDWRPERARERPILDYVRRLANLETAFGRDHLTVRLFTRRALAGGCVVRDFCGHLGLGLPESAIRRENDSLPADATRMLYCFHRFQTQSPPLPPWRSRLLAMRLAELKGDRLRFHSRLLEPLAEEFARQEREVLDRHGIDLRDDRPDDETCVREQADLYRFAPDSLDWLARASGRALIDARGDEATGRAVAAQVNALARRPHARSTWRLVQEELARKFRWIRHGH